MLVEKGTESRGSARYRQVRLLVLQNQRHKAVLPGSDLLAKSLAQERWSDRSAVEQDRINAWAIVQEFGEMSRDRAVGRIREAPIPAVAACVRYGRASASQKGKNPSSNTPSISARVTVAA